MIPIAEKPRFQGLNGGSSIPGIFDFDLPRELEASQPPEARGLSRDQVRLMISHNFAHRGFEPGVS